MIVPSPNFVTNIQRGTRFRRNLEFFCWIDQGDLYELERQAFEFFGKSEINRDMKKII